MRELIELRIPKAHADCVLGPVLGPEDGTDLDTVRKLRLDTDDPRLAVVEEASRRFRAAGKSFFYGWQITRHYSRKEFDAADLFRLVITSTFEPAGEECGTAYDYSSACSVCGAGRRQVSDLRLDPRKLPKRGDIARTIADEWVVSQRLAELLTEADVTGLELRRVRPVERYEDDPIDPQTVPAGRELLSRARAVGLSPDVWEFWVWANRDPQRELADRMPAEHAAQQRSAGRPRRRFPSWYQLVPTSKPVEVQPPTRFGIDPFDEDAKGEYRCPRGHVKGLNLLSELSVSGSSYDRSDFVITRELVGDRRGLLVPTPLMLVSRRVGRLLREERIRGHRLEVARLV